MITLYKAWDPHKKEMLEVNFINYSTEEIDWKGNLNEPKMWYHFTMIPSAPFKDVLDQQMFETDIITFEDKWGENIVSEIQFHERRILCNMGRQFGAYVRHS